MTPKGMVDVAVLLSNMAGNDGVQGPLAGRDAVGVAGLEDEAGAAVLQDDARFGRHDAAAEAVSRPN